MNQIEIQEEVVKLLDNDGKIELIVPDKIDVFDITKVMIHVKEDTDIHIMHNGTSECKLDVTIHLFEGVTCHLYELKQQNHCKIKYTYDLEKRSCCTVHKFYDCSNVKELDIIELNGVGATMEYLFHTISSHPQKYDIIVYHNARDTISHIITKGVSIKEGSILLNVTGIVYNGIKNCTIEQNHRIINMNDNTCQINPILLIEENDVIANHSAHIGKFDENVIFYLMSRGIPYDAALSLLVRGFLMDNTVYKEEIQTIIEQYWR